MTRVRHPAHGPGTVLAELGEITAVEFDGGGILKVRSAELSALRSPVDALRRPEWDPPLPTLARALAQAISSTHQRWGVFLSARVTLLPHQLWVCHRVLARWPSRWLIADDVGLGKTIEAGLILTPLLSQGLVQRLLIICPASLVDQWVERLREMFDVRATRYHPDLDRDGDDFWQQHRQVIVSLHTVRLDRKRRWERLFEAEPWDLVLVDEAHHLNADERSGRTLGMQLLEELNERRLIRGLLLFTGTPHRGVDHGFLSLLRLLRPDINPAQPLAMALPHLPELVIRNNKQNVTDMAGQRLFHPPRVVDIRYRYSPEEEQFYQRLTEFIITGRAYASSTRLRSQRSVMLVLTALQKLAASSVAAVHRALAGRLDRLRAREEDLPGRQAELERVWKRLADDPDGDALSEDERAALEERIDELMVDVQLNPDEIPALAELVTRAVEVPRESRVDRLMELIEGLGDDRQILLFTEYKATQALVVSALALRYGAATVGFINGDGALPGVLARPEGPPERWTAERRHTAARFNAGELRFLVSTEAAGEGIDLHHRCSTLVHVDMPWNPMRMHQRVGRLNRFGQTTPVTVYILRNPDTVEGRIWSLLEEKLDRIGAAFAGSMADPDDIRALVLGLSPAGLHEQVAEQALSTAPGTFRHWYDAKTGAIGGERAMTVIRAILGNTSRFHFATDGEGVPKVDLPDLVPFVQAALRLRGRRPEERPDGTWAFRTPEPWMAAHHAIRDRYHVHFQRGRAEVRGGPVLLGGGHRLLDAALADMRELPEVCAVVEGLEAPLWLYACRDALSAPGRPTQQVLLGMLDAAQPRLLQDWELVVLLNPLVRHPDRAQVREARPAPRVDAASREPAARAALGALVPGLQLPFEAPELHLQAVLWPAEGAPEA
jgi:hypothetical protein